MPTSSIVSVCIPAAFFLAVAMGSLASWPWAVIFPGVLLIALGTWVRMGWKAGRTNEVRYLDFLREVLLAIPIRRE